jgi:hypothetical protein
VPKRRRRDYIMAAPCSPMEFFQLKELLDQLVSLQVKVIWPDNKHSAKQMIPTSIFK